MTDQPRPCPKCNGTMNYRLGEYECAQCGHFQLAEPIEVEEAKPKYSGPGFTTPKQAPTSLAPSSRMLGHKVRDDAEVPRSTLSQEKVTFLTVVFAMQVLVPLGYALVFGSPVGGLLALPGMIVGGVFTCLCYGVVLYYDNECLRQGCVIYLGLGVLGSITGFILMLFGAGATVGGLGVLRLYLLPYLAINIWLLTILMRDRRSDEGCF